MSPPAKLDNRVIPEYLNVKFFESSLRNEFKNDNIKVVDLSIKYATSGGDNYTSDIYRATIKYKSNENQNEPTDLSLIVKSIPEVGVRKEILDDFKIYIKEVQMYTEILPVLSNSLNEEFLNAKCFYAESSPIPSIVFQDLGTLKFRLSDRKAGLDMDHCKLVLKKLAKLHASSMPFIDNNPEVVEKYFNFGIFSRDTFTEGAVMRKMFEDGFKTLPEIVYNWSAEFKAISGKLKKISDNLEKLIFTCLENDKIKVKVLNHGDMWVNNIMFKYDETGKVTDTIFVDYQLSCYNSLGLDLNYFLATSPNNEIRITQRTNMIDYYYKCFSATLKQLNIKDIPTLEEVHNEMFLMEFYGLLSCVVVLPIVLAEKMQEETNFDVMVNEETADHFRRQNFNSPLYVKAMQPIIKRLDKIGVLDYYSRIH